MEKISDSIREFIEKNEILNFLMKIVEYLIYAISIVMIAMPFIALPELTDLAIKYLFFISAILAFAARKYISLSVLLLSCMFFNVVCFIKNLFYTDIIIFSFTNLVNAVVCFIVVWFLMKEHGNLSTSKIKFLNVNKIKADIQNEFINKINKYNDDNAPRIKK